MNAHLRWLLGEIEHWASDRLISAEQADQLRGRYTKRETYSAATGTVFTAAGAVVSGLGIILLFAFNWASIPKFGKLALIFGAIAAAHLAGLKLRSYPDSRRGLGATMSLLGTMFFGAGIWLVAQIYHFDEHYSTGFLIWAIGALAMAWVLDSVPHGLLGTVLIAIWAACDDFSFKQPQLWAAPIVALSVLPLAWRLRSAGLLAVALTALQFLLLVNLAQIGTGGHMVTSSLAWGAGLIAASRLLRAGFARGASVAYFFGFLAVILGTYLLTFSFGWRYLADGGYPPRPENEFASLHTWLLFALAIAVWIGAILGAVRRRLRWMSVDEWLAIVILGQTYALIWGHFSLLPRILYPFSLLLLGIAGTWIWQGSRDHRTKRVVLGLLLLSALVVARYFDLMQNYAARGTVFAVVGLVLIGTGILFRKRGTPAAKEVVS